MFKKLFSKVLCTFFLTPDGECFHERIHNWDVSSRQVFSHHIRVTPNEYQIRRLRYTHKAQHEETGYHKTTSRKPAFLLKILYRIEPDADEAQIESIPSDREIQVYANRILHKKLTKEKIILIVIIRYCQICILKLYRKITTRFIK